MRTEEEAIQWKGGHYPSGAPSYPHSDHPQVFEHVWVTQGGTGLGCTPHLISNNGEAEDVCLVVVRLLEVHFRSHVHQSAGTAQLLVVSRHLGST